ncbi:MAG TPA: right-handed parallel beta-helix repeat-containing protein [Actinomycetes bacterium]|jgi:parallel beta-helix repeat protein|nr:right-handed parallel beta-helix repeat-containing protein [Actinomycetes bacterium]
MRSDRGSRHAAQAGPSRHLHAARNARAARRATQGKPRRSRIIGAAILVPALAGALTLAAKAFGPPPRASQTRPAALLGAWVKGGSQTPSSQQAATRQLEAAIGRKLSIGHSLVPWGRGLGSLPALNMAEGRTPLISFGKGSNPRAVAAGVNDAYFTSLAHSVGALGRPVLLRYDWDVGGAAHRVSTRSGSAFVAAWRHVHDLFAAQGVRASWVWSRDADAFAGARGEVDRFWPGDDYVDWIGADGFNWNSCDGRSGWSGFGAIFKAFYAWGSARGKPLMVAETGTVEDPADPGRKAAWYLDAASTLARSMPRIRAVVYVHEGGRCDWRPDTSSRSMQGFIRFARDPFFAGAGDPAGLLSTTTVPATTAAATTVPATSAPPATTAPPATARRPPRASKCATGGGVAIATGDDAQRVLDAHGAGTTYVVKAGTHQQNFSVQPKSGDTFCGEHGAVLDGGRRLQFAFSGRGTNVTLDSITVQNYNTGRQRGAIQPDTHASGWVVRNVSALNNQWAGLMGADGMKILGGHYADNDQLGIGGNAATGIILDGLDGDPTTFDGPELARNHAMHESCYWESGGMKWDVGQVTVRNAYVHDNDCRGLWADINARGALLENNLIQDNRLEGIFYEISQDAVVRNNQIYRNGHGGQGWYWAGGITVASSFNVEVYGNRLSGNHNGITGTQQDRTDSTPPAHRLDHYHVHDNLICATSGRHPTGVAADNGADLGARDITFSGNRIQSAACQ